MGRKRTIAAITGLTLLATGALGVSSASGDTAIHVILQGNLKVHITDLDGNGFTLGDRLVARGPLVYRAKPNKRVGTAYLDCWVAKNEASGHGLFDCTYLLHLPGGDLTLQGLDPPGPGASNFAVTGGDRAYRDARGDAVFTDSPPASEPTCRSR